MAELLVHPETILTFRERQLAPAGLDVADSTHGIAAGHLRLGFDPPTGYACVAATSQPPGNVPEE